MLPRAGRLAEWMPEEFERLWNNFFTEPMMEAPETYPWGMTMGERENEVIVRAELPGFTPEEVRVEMLGNRLTIEAEHRVPAEGTPEIPPREHTRVRRVLTLPVGIDPERTEAVYRNGVLEVHLPRTPEATGRRIELKT